MIPDIKTLMLLYLITNVINTGAIAVIWSQHRGRFAGISLWLVGLALQVAGPLLLVLRGLVPDLISMTGSNTIILAGVLIVLMGLERFTGKKGRQIHNYVLLAVFIAVSAYFVVVQPNLMAQDIAVSAMLMIYTFQACWLLLRRVDPGMRQITLLTGTVFAVYAAFSLARIILTIIISEQSNDFFKSGAVNSLAITGYILLNICLTISLVLMVNRRLLGEVQDQEEKFTTAFHSSPYAIILTRLSNGTIFEVNNGFLNISGYQYAEVIGRTTLDLHLWVNEEDRLAVINELAQGREIYGVEYQFRDKTGKVLTGLFSASLVTVNNETCILSSIGDITERKQAEESLKVSEIKYRVLFESLPLGATVSDKAGNIKESNKEAERLLGLSLEIQTQRSIDGQEWRIVRTDGSLMPADEYASVRALRENRVIENVEMGIVKGEGVITWINVTAAPIPLPEYGVVIAYTDITWRKQAEEALRESEEKYRLLVENANEAIFVAQDGKLVFLNPITAIMIGHSSEELMAKPFIEFIHPDDRNMVLGRHLERLKGERLPQVYSFRIIHRDGNIRWVELNTILINWYRGKGTLNFLSDITDRKMFEEEHQRLEKLESVGTLAGGIAHDFNNILTAILGNISLARMEAKAGSEMHDRLEEAEKASLQAKGLTQQLLTFSKGGAPIKKLASVSELLKDTASFALRGSNIKCQCSIPDDLWHAEIDEGQISQVISNLVINARQAMPTGGIMEIRAENMTLTKKQQLGRSLPLKQGDYVRITVADHGIGIPSQYIDNIFDPYFTTKQTGSGLGLSTSYSILRKHDGHISVESKANVGSTFYVYLPASKKKVKAIKKDDKKKLPVGEVRILVMDDEDMVRDVAGRMLKHIGYDNVEFAADGEEAIKLCREAKKSAKPFAVVILDLTIPGGMGGKEAVKRLLEIDPQVKAIVSSGYADVSVMAEFKEYGFKGMVAKPYTLEQLRKTLHEVFGEAQD